MSCLRIICIWAPPSRGPGWSPLLTGLGQGLSRTNSPPPCICYRRRRLPAIFCAPRCRLQLHLSLASLGLSRSTGSPEFLRFVGLVRRRPRGSLGAPFAATLVSLHLPPAAVSVKRQPRRVSHSDITIPEQQYHRPVSSCLASSSLGLPFR